MWILIGGLLTLLSGFAWGREAAFRLGLVGTGMIWLLGHMGNTWLPYEGPPWTYKEEEEFIRRGGRKALHRMLRVLAGMLVSLILLVIAGY